MSTNPGEFQLRELCADQTQHLRAGLRVRFVRLGGRGLFALGQRGTRGSMPSQRADHGLQERGLHVQQQYVPAAVRLQRGEPGVPGQ